MQDPKWITIAKSYEGVKEIPGTRHNQVILGWLKELKSWFTDDETPWCGTFVAHCLKNADRDIPKNWFRAKEWLSAGTAIPKPAYGCVVVFSRNGGGHVGFVVGEDEKGNLMVLGGNQSNQVCVSAFPKLRVLGYIWPAFANGLKDLPTKDLYQLPKYRGKQQISSNEE